MKKSLALAAIAVLALFQLPTTAQAQWSLTGNSISAGNFLGTTNAADVIFKRNNTQSGLLSSINTSFGVSSLNSSLTGSGNTAVGIQSSPALTTGYNNNAFGNYSLFTNTTGYNNTALGTNALFTNLSGSFNTAVGLEALYSNSSGTGNSASGYASLKSTTGSNNSALGNQSLYSNTSGNNNSAIGYYAGLNLTTGSDNVFIGKSSGNGISTGSNNTIIGANTFGLPAALANTVILSDGSGNIRLYADNAGNVGLGGFSPTNLPTAKLEIKSAAANTSGLKFTNLNSSSAASAANGKSLSVDNNGTVILVPASGATLWDVSPIGTGNIINSNLNGVIIGTGVTSLPSGYKLYVSNGILTEKVKIAVKNSTNWADYVFQKNYSLMPLQEVEYFINAHKHLPGVPSADEIVKDGGIDVTQMMAKQMEKIEELTLYIISLQKEVETLKNNLKH